MIKTVIAADAQDHATSVFIIISKRGQIDTDLASFLFYFYVNILIFYIALHQANEFYTFL